MSAWPTVKVGAVARQIRGVSYAKEDASKEPRPGYVPLLRANNITAVGLTFDNLIFVPPARVNADQHLRSGDLVVAASSGSLDVVGKAAQVKGSFHGTFGAFCKALRPSASVDPRYFAHFFCTPEYRTKVSSLAAGANINNLRNEHLDDLDLPLPPLTEQRRIAAILDEADALQAKRRAAVAQIGEVARAIFLDMFGDPHTNSRQLPLKTVDEVCSRLTVGYVSSMVNEYAESGIPMLRSLNVRRNAVLFDDLKFVSLSFHRSLGKSSLRPGDVVTVRTGRPGTTAVVPDTLPEANCADLIVMTCGDDILPHYLSEVLNQLLGDAEHIQGAVGAIQSHFNIGAMRRCQIPIPPMQAQREYAEHLDEVRRLSAAAGTALSATDSLFASLQHRAFRGEL